MHVVSIVVLVLWLLALGRTILNLLLLPKLSTDAKLSSEPFVSIVVPARNESHGIEDTVRAFLAQDYQQFELIVVNDRSTDATAEILARFSDSRLAVIEGEEPPAGWLGKPWALEQGSRRARGELILFADADIIYAPSAVRAAVGSLLASDATLIALYPYFEMHGFGEQVGMAMLPFALAMLPAWLSNRWQRPRLAIGAGAGNLIRRDRFEAAGRFGELCDAVVDDVGLAQLARKVGGKTYAVRAENLVRVRMYHGTQAVIEGFTKNIFVGIGRSYLAAIVLIALLVIGSLLPYALAFTGDPYWIAVVAAITIIRLLLFGTLGYSLLNAIFLHPVMILLWTYILVRSVWITGVRKQVRWRGRVYDSGRTRFGAGR